MSERNPVGDPDPTTDDLRPPHTPARPATTHDVPSGTKTPILRQVFGIILPIGTSEGMSRSPMWRVAADRGSHGRGTVVAPRGL